MTRATGVFAQKGPRRIGAILRTAVMSIDFKAHLSRQLTFLWRSCEAYDEGHTDEAVRIASVIRVLIHDTPKSTSLLNHLGALGISLSSTVSSLDT